MQVTANKRVFVHNGARLSDPDKTISPAAVKDVFSAMYPELLNAEIQGPDVEGDEVVYTFHRTTGTKGAVTKRLRKSVMSKKAASFVGRLSIAAGETTVTDSALPPSKLTKLHSMMLPSTGAQPLSLPSSSFALLL